MSQHSGDGKANQYYLRGFNLDHGTDFATFVDGIPANMPTHTHGQGYTDLNWLIPTVVDRINYRKGPYYYQSTSCAPSPLRNSGRIATFNFNFWSSSYRETVMSDRIFSLVIRGGTVIDGTGSDPVQADVGICGDRIKQVGANLPRGETEIDAKNLLVTPGFVDLHTHYDGQATWDDYLAPSSWHGVTTAVMSNCGVGFAPVHAHGRESLIKLMEGVEDIPGPVLHEGLDFNWESFSDYLTVLESRHRDIDICAQLPHAALRLYVMGERAMRLEDATDSDIAAMRQLAKEAMLAGALGFSTSRTLNHRTLAGDPIPTLRATEAELTGIAMGLRDAGTGMLQVVSDWDAPDLETEFSMLRRVVEASGRPLLYTVNQRHDEHRNRWKELMAKGDQAAAEGLPIRPVFRRGSNAGNTLTAFQRE